MEERIQIYPSVTVTKSLAMWLQYIETQSEPIENMHDVIRFLDTCGNLEELITIHKPSEVHTDTAMPEDDVSTYVTEQLIESSYLAGKAERSYRRKEKFRPELEIKTKIKPRGGKQLGNWLKRMGHIKPKYPLAHEELGYTEGDYSQGETELSQADEHILNLMIGGSNEFVVFTSEDKAPYERPRYGIIDEEILVDNGLEGVTGSKEELPFHLVTGLESDDFVPMGGVNRRAKLKNALKPSQSVAACPFSHLKGEDKKCVDNFVLGIYRDNPFDSSHAYEHLI